MPRGEKKVKESRRSFPGEEVEEGEFWGQRESEKVQKFGWGRGGEREGSKGGASVGNDTAASRKVDGSGRRKRRGRREEPAGTHSAISGTGPREGEGGGRGGVGG
jgi:hypothetical protein